MVNLLSLRNPCLATQVMKQNLNLLIILLQEHYQQFVKETLCCCFQCLIWTKILQPSSYRPQRCLYPSSVQKTLLILACSSWLSLCTCSLGSSSLSTSSLWCTQYRSHRLFHRSDLHRNLPKLPWYVKDHLIPHFGSILGLSLGL
jgi:hypothetical protein